ncbi:hypothetical protein SAMN05660649_04869 [Desulfotomaculum arcticum]|uniref:SEC-C motif-containing protein n=1 Tax=Desulfotruncus arcticus DSM 17038 TaxID=1121424 RepID=A0A1I2ZCJ0_9FIRM|nr:hypothetical protein [Desulfotruncus arcticus]SFH35315.1 hypothetical protein SAMN05660649_04869 [Desulfotomaculum arcticum] [Desulfotruncus arcticus DSM 17038]
MSNKKCSCGSGKSADACCGPSRKVIDLNEYRWRRAGRHLRRKLAEFADNDIFTNDVEIARELFFDTFDPELVDEEDDLMLERFFEWFIFDYKIQNQTILEYFSLADNLASEERELLESWKKTKSSFYQVVRIERQSVLVIEDLIRGRQVKVTDKNAAKELEEGHIMLMRVLPVGNDYEFSTGGMVLPLECKSYLLSRVKQDADLYWSKYKKRGDWDQYLADRAHVLNSLVVELETIWNFSSFDEETNKKTSAANKGHMDGMAQQVTNIFLDYFYDRWVNEPMDVLQGKTPMEASKTKEGREKLQTLIKELGKIEKARAQKGEPYYDLTRLRKKLKLPAEVGNRMTKGAQDESSAADYAGVAELIRDGLKKMGYHAQQVNNALEMWQQYSKAARPAFRKPGAWAAAIIYAVARLLGDESVSQNELALMYNVSASTISANYRSICKTLQLKG